MKRLLTFKLFESDIVDYRDKSPKIVDDLISDKTAWSSLTTQLEFSNIVKVEFIMHERMGSCGVKFRYNIKDEELISNSNNAASFIGYKLLSVASLDKIKDRIYKEIENKIVNYPERIKDLQFIPKSIQEKYPDLHGLIKASDWGLI